MGEFFEPEAGGDEILKPKPSVFTQEFFEHVVKKSIEDGDVLPDAKLIFVAATDEKGAKAIIAVSIVNKEHFKIKLNGIFEHDWGGDNRVGAKVIASFK